jgi:hypothetical protein
MENARRFRSGAVKLREPGRRFENLPHCSPQGKPSSTTPLWCSPELLPFPASAVPGRMLVAHDRIGPHLLRRKGPLVGWGANRWLWPVGDLISSRLILNGGWLHQLNGARTAAYLGCHSPKRETPCERSSGSRRPGVTANNTLAIEQLRSQVPGTRVFFHLP